MCGIAGQFNFQRRAPVERETIARMARSIAHRGPDDEGFFISGPVGLGFRRLSIIDLAGGHQPMSDAQETVWVIFNGEIYNYKELREELQGKGHQFRTNSDTEVIIHGYKQWGTDVFNHLNGMFGLAIWDVQKERLIVARDAMGIKLIYYRIDNGALNFRFRNSRDSGCAKITAGCRSCSVEPVSAFSLYAFSFDDISRHSKVGTRHDAGCGERPVPRRTLVQVHPDSFSDSQEKGRSRSELLELYRGAVKRHLLSDVPVGMLLSGGLDSGLLLALMNEQGGPWPAYTVGYGESFDDDELTDAAETASLFGARHVTVRLDQAEFERSLPKIVECLEEPIATSSIVPMYFVSQRARQDVKVALIGQGPDELFGGYKRHLGVHYGNWWRGLPAGLRSMAGFAVNRLPRNETLKRGVRSLGSEGSAEALSGCFFAGAGGIDRWSVSRRRLPQRNGHELVDYWRDLLPQMEHTDELGGFQLLEIRSSLPDELLMYADKLSMAHSLEVRVPYLDRTVVEYVQRLGADLKVRNGTRKWLHRQVCQNYLSPQILKRKKRGFAVNVVDQWFHSSLNGALREVLMDESSLMFGLLNPKPVERLLEGHQSGRQDNHKLLFSLVMLEQWLRGSWSRRDQLISAAQEGIDAARLVS